jgi:Ca-activated chloride channel family protein
MTETLRLTVVPSRLGIARQGGGVHLLVQVDPPDTRPDAERRPVALALVVDRSGSMSEPAVQLGTAGAPGADIETPCKLDYVKEAALRMLDLMPDGDAVSLVTFDDEVAVAKPLTILSKSSRTALARAIRAIEVGGSTNLEGGLRVGVQQMGIAKSTYSAKLVLLSDGLANVGEDRPAVLGEIAAGAAHNGITTSTLGVGMDYHLGLMSHVAECGNGEFHHVGQLSDLEVTLAGEFLDAAAVTARGGEVTLRLPDLVAVGSNLNRYPQVNTDGGVRVAIGDLVHRREFIVELTTPVEVAGESLRIEAMAEGRGVDGNLLEARVNLVLPLLSEHDAAALQVDETIVGRAVERLQAKADMDSSVAAEAGDYRAAKYIVAQARDSAMQLSQHYGTALAGRAQVGSTVDYLEALAGRLDAPDDPSIVKARYAAASLSTRGRGRMVGACPVCGEKAFFEMDLGGHTMRSCNACGHEERS